MRKLGSEFQGERSISKRSGGKNVILRGSLLVLLSGCGSNSGDSVDRQPAAAARGETRESPATAQNETKVDACSLLTDAEVEAVLGVEVGTPTPSGSMYGDANCSYEAASSRIVAPTVTVTMWSSAYTMQELLNSLKENAGVDAFQPVPGIGDEAYWGAETLYVRKGKRIFSVAAGALEQKAPSTALEAAKALAQKAVARVT